MPPDAAGEVPEEEEAARAPQACCRRVLCSQSGAFVPTASPVAERVIGSMLDARFRCALRAFALCAKAVHGATSEAHGCSGRRRSSSPSATLFTARLGRVMPLQWRLRAARFRLCMIAFVPSACVRRAEGCPEPTLTSCPARHRVYLVMPTAFLRSGRVTVIIPMRRFNFSMYDLEIFTPLLSVITLT